jgi:hypothetical protein
VSLRKDLIALPLLAATVAFAQQQPPVKVNVINVCSPSAEDQKELSAALAQLPAKPVFASDFEVSRGRSTLDANASIPGMQPLPAGTKSTANWVRMRRELSENSPYSNVQYSFSVDEANMVETLVLRVREPKDVMQISIEDSASAVTSPTVMLTSATPVSRIKLERFGKSSVVLARCSGSGEEGKAGPDQSAYEPVFRSASAVMNRYRDILGARRLVPQELARLSPPKVEKRAVPVKK